MLTHKISFASKLHGESQHANLQHCLSQEKQHSIMRTIFATGFTGRGELDEFVLFHVFLSCVLKCRRSERHKRTVQGRYFIDVFVWF